MRAPGLASVAVVLVLASLAACGSNNGDDTGDNGGVDACVGLECMQVTCPAGTTTSLSGIVYAPNGTLPLYNVNVYVPNGQVADFPSGAQCDRCGAPLSGNPVVQAVTDTQGRFVLEDVPVVPDLPLVIQVGKWRRIVTIPTVTMCADNPLDEVFTRLPRNKSEGDIPQMALTTGGADSLECLLRKIGLDDSEFTNASGTGRVHLYAGSGGTPRFNGALGGADFANATTLWDDTASLSAYDVTFLSCEGSQNPSTKPAPARQALFDYTNLGGRVFASHWHNYWIEDGPDPWPSTVNENHLPDLGNITGTVNTGFARGAALAEWLLNVGGSTQLGQIALTDTQHTVESVDEPDVEKWIYADQTSNGEPSVQYFQFTTPLTVQEADRCGKVVFSDIHVSTGDDSSGSIAFPNGCTTTGLTPQEKVLAFMIFDIASCVGPPIGKPARD